MKASFKQDLLRYPPFFAYAGGLLLIVTIIFYSIPEPPPKEAIHWKPFVPLEKLSTDKLILLDVTATWCPPCKKMKRTTFKDKKLGKYVNTHFYPLRIEADPELSPEVEPFLKKLRFQGYPTLYVLKRDGRILDVLEGYYYADTLLRELKSFIEYPMTSYYYYPDHQELASKDKLWLIFLPSNYVKKSIDALLNDPAYVPWLEEYYEVFVFKFYNYYRSFYERSFYQRVLRALDIRCKPAFIILDPKSNTILRRIDHLPTPEEWRQFIAIKDKP